MRIQTLFFILASIAVLGLLWSCEPSSPGAPQPNIKPVARISVAPVENSSNDHFISPQPMFRVQWFGSDPDGVVLGFYLKIDDGAEVWTTRGDSAIAFTSNEPDPANPGKTLPKQHTIRVWAVDNEGLRSDPASRTFFAVNSIPKITNFAAPFPNNATVGPAISFSVEYSDSNLSGMWFRLWVDDNPVTDWDERSKFQFYNTSDPSLLNNIETGDVLTLDMNLLTNGPHQIWIKVMDWGGAVSDSVMRTITVADTFSPAIASIRSTYGSAEYYPDGSIFFAPLTSTHFSINGSAASYYGTIQSYRYRLTSTSNPDPAWSAWGGSTVDFNDIPPGEYQFEAQCRDYTGTLSDVNSYQISIVQPDFSRKTILVVDETRDGNSSLGSPDDAQVDEFYRYILRYDTVSFRNPSGWEFSEIDYTTHKVGNKKYVSAKDVYNQRIIIWHAEDKSVLDLKTNAENRRVLSEYLDKGGKLIISGWDLMANFTDADSAGFPSGFVAKYLRVRAGQRTTDRSFVNVTGYNDWPGITLDRTKIPDRWTGIDRCWALTASHRTDTIAVWADNTPLAGKATVLLNLSPVNAWRTATFGFPLYFMNKDETSVFINRVISELDASD